MDVYSVTLALSLAAAVIALGLAIYWRVVPAGAYLAEHPALVVAAAVAASAILLLGTTRTRAVAGTTIPDGRGR